MLKGYGYSFAALFCLIYPVLLFMNWQTPLYYPLEQRWAWDLAEQARGPAMQWYGLVLATVIAAALLAWPLSRWPKLAGSSLMFLPWLSMVLIVWDMRGFFGA